MGKKSLTMHKKEIELRLQVVSKTSFFLHLLSSRKPVFDPKHNNHLKQCTFFVIVMSKVSILNF